MKKFIYILLFLLSFGCANKRSNSRDLEPHKTYELEKKQLDLSENDAYTLLITQKLEEYIDTKTLAKANPDFVIKTDQKKLLSLEEGTKIKHINFISPFESISDSIKKVTTRVVLDHKVDTILTFIKTSQIEIDGKQLLTTKISFDTLKK